MVSGVCGRVGSKAFGKSNELGERRKLSSYPGSVTGLLYDMGQITFICLSKLDIRIRPGKNYLGGFVVPSPAQDPDLVLMVYIFLSPSFHICKF